MCNFQFKLIFLCSLLLLVSFIKVNLNCFPRSEENVFEPKYFLVGTNDFVFFLIIGLMRQELIRPKWVLGACSLWYYVFIYLDVINEAKCFFFVTRLFTDISQIPACSEGSIWVRCFEQMKLFSWSCFASFGRSLFLTISSHEQDETIQLELIEL